MARHAAVDLGLVYQSPPVPPPSDRLSSVEFARLHDSLRQAGLELHDGTAVHAALTELRALYEPFINALAIYFQFAVPPFLPNQPVVDNWQTSPWTRRSPDLSSLPTASALDVTMTDDVH